MDKAVRTAILFTLMFSTAIPTFRFIDSTLFVIKNAYHGYCTQISLRVGGYYLGSLLVGCTVLFFASSHLLLRRVLSMIRRFIIFPRLWVVIEVIVLANVVLYGGIAIRDFTLPYFGFNDICEVTYRVPDKVAMYGAVFTGPYLEIQVSPPGYPTPWQSWTIDVYEVNVTSGIRTFQPALNANVVINLLYKGRFPRTYELPVDENGRASFQFLPEHSDIAFQAYKTGWRESKPVILHVHYAPHSDVDTILISLPFSVILGVIGLLTRKRVSKFTFVTLILTFCIICFVTLISFYLRFFQFTIWGYPKIIYSFITTDLLKYIYFPALISLFVLVFWIYLQPNLGPEAKTK